MSDENELLEKNRLEKSRMKHYMLRQNLRAAEGEKPAEERRRVAKIPSESKNGGYTACIGSKSVAAAVDHMRKSAIGSSLPKDSPPRSLVGNFHYAIDTTTGHFFLHSFDAPNMDVSFVEKRGLSYSSEKIPNSEFSLVNMYVMDCLHRLLEAGTRRKDVVVSNTGAPLTPLGRAVLETESRGIAADVKIRPRKQSVSDADSPSDLDVRRLLYSQMSDQEKAKAWSKRREYASLYETGVFADRSYAPEYVRGKFEYVESESLGMDDFLGGRGEFRDFYMMRDYGLLLSTSLDFDRRVPEIESFLKNAASNEENVLGRGPNDMIFRVKRDMSKTIMFTGANGFYAGDFDLVVATETPDGVRLSLAEAKRKEFGADDVSISVGAVQRMVMEVVNEALANSADVQTKDMFGRPLSAAPVEKIRNPKGEEKDNFFYIMDSYSGQKYDRLLSTNKAECGIEGWYLLNRNLEALGVGKGVALECRNDLVKKQEELGCGSYLEALAYVQETFLEKAVAKKKEERKKRKEKNARAGGAGVPLPLQRCS